MKTRTKLTNSFHDSHTTVIGDTFGLDRTARAAERGEKWAKRYMRDVARRLCPSKSNGCTCSNAWGERA